MKEKTKLSRGEKVDLQRMRLLEMQQGMIGLNRLFSQLRIIQTRIRYDMARVEAVGGFGVPGESSDTLQLDVETFYTVAFDVLKVVKIVLAGAERKGFEEDDRYKNICGLRNNLIRHAYDGSQADPSNAYAYSPTSGLILKAGVGVVIDRGYLQNAGAFWELLIEHGVLDGRLANLSTTPEATLSDKMIARLMGTKTV